MLRRLGEGATNRLVAATDGLSADLAAMGAKQVILEERLAKLEGEMRAGPATSADDSHALSDELSACFERIMGLLPEQRDHDLIVFDLTKVLSENYTKIITKVLSFLDVSVSSSEIARVYKIPGIHPRLHLLSNLR